MLPTILIGLSVLTLLPLQSISTQAYPVTSEPIEGTAENLAWQKYILQESEERSKGNNGNKKKSIFNIPNRNDCPIGNHADGSGCIPTVSIDPDFVGKQQLIAVIAPPNLVNNYEYEYDDDDGSAIVEQVGLDISLNSYDAPEMLTGEQPTNIDSADQLPRQDGPTRYNLPPQKFSSDENETTPDAYDDDVSNNETQIQSNLQNNQTLITQMAKVFLNKHETNSTNQLSNNTVMHNYLNNTLNIDLSMENGNISSNAFNSNSVIAIAVSASIPLQTNLTVVAEHLDNSAEQLITSADLKQHKDESQTELALLFQADSLLPLLDTDKKPLNNRTTKTAEMSSSIEDYAAEMPSDEPENKEKTDHIRSIVENLLLSVSDLSAQEADFTTTLEPDGTTSFQVDDTTIIEAVNPPTIELQELKAKRARKPSNEPQQQQQQSELEEKSKVEPVTTQLSVDHEVTMTAAETTSETTTAPLPTISTHKSEIIDGIVDVDVGVNRFTYLDDDVANLMSTATTTTEIIASANAQTETWGTISELVKGRTTETTAKQTILATTVIPPTTTTTINNRDIIAEQSETHSDSHINKLTYIEMETTTSAAEAAAETTTNGHNNNKESLLTNADVGINDDVADADDTSEIVFVVTNKKHLFTSAAAAVESEESFMPTTTTTIITSTPITNKEITETSAQQTNTSKRWSKVRPIFESTTTTAATDEQLVDEAATNIEQIILAEQQQHLKIENNIEAAKSTTIMATLPPITEVVTAKSSSISISEKRKSSRRNSKIIHLDKYPIADSVNSLSETTTTTTAITPTTQTELSVVNPMDANPFWWLPPNWRLDRRADVEGPPLLLRLWTTFTSDKQAKV